MWRKPDRSADALGPTWSDVRTAFNSAERRRRVLRWSALAVTAIVLASAVGVIFLSAGSGVNSWGLVAAVAVGAVSIVLLLVRLMLGSLLPYEIGRGVYRWIAEKRRHRTWSKQAAQRDLFKR